MADPIRFDRSLYVPEAVDAAAAAYAEHARIEVAATPDGVSVTISDVVGHELDDVVNAFCNHVLYETISRLRQAV